MARKKKRTRNAKPVAPEKRARPGLLWGGVAAVALSIGGALFYFLSGSPQPRPFDFAQDRPLPEGKATRATAVSVTAQYVGSSACASCHDREMAEWQKSQHHDAMAEANEKSVLGNFANAKFSYAGITSTFFKRNGRFFVNTDGPDGKRADFGVKYTFGIYPLQQYLIEFSDGRLQALSIAWDARPKTQGGQRWFHLYPKQRITHNDELHWTRPSQNWNFMCADCHSTEIRKNYDPSTDKFQTRWSEINVGCEACHGPGSRHLEWAKAEGTRNPAASDPAKGLSARLDERRNISWHVNAASGNAVRSLPRTSEREIEVCAQCHARRSQIAERYSAGKRFLDYYRPELLTNPLYYADGQQRAEVYSWGSFLQSKMYASGVTCSDCHNPHSGKLRAEGNALCVACHLASKYDTAAHHHHKIGNAGAACVSCHMPTTTYMVIDPRHDHSLRVARPDLSVKLGTPNPCNGCHKNRDAKWAATQVNHWYGLDPQGYQRFAPAFFAADNDALDAQAQLAAIAGDSTQPPIARATALAQIRGDAKSLAEGLRDPSPVVRLGALQSLANAPANSRVSLAAPLLADPMRAVCLEAVSVLAPVPAAQLSPDERGAFERAAREYVATQSYNADRPEAHLNLGTFYGNRGDAARAEEEIKTAIRMEPSSIPAYVNLADLYRAGGRDADGERLLREGLKKAPNSAILHHALGLALVRLKRSDEALPEFERASALDPGNPRFAYVYAVALHSAGKSDAAIANLEKALQAHPNDRDILEGLASFRAARGENEAAKRRGRLD
ncbi:MAG TPA: tetratricopeptide repeat protein [Candidatus Binatia bacterium]|nr:tetratricopeptide repeat protein [Candidatus Binatia bacterium]